MKFFIAFLLLGGLSASPLANAEIRHEYLEIKLTNTTAERIDETAILFGKRRCTMGVFGPGGSATYLGWLPPVGTNATVRWRDAKKTKREAMVSLIGVYDPRFPGVLQFAIGTTNATVTFKKIDRK